MERPEWSYKIDRTEYTDEIFSRIGRLLYKATSFESYCRIASARILSIDNVNILEDPQAFEQFLEKLQKTVLTHHVQRIQKSFDYEQMNELFKEAIIARNSLAHDLTLGLEHIFGDEDKEDQLEWTINDYTNKIVQAEYHAILVSCILFKTEFPRTTYVDENINWVLND
jgi:hypothetical protein